MIASVLHAASLARLLCGKQLRACCNSLTSSRLRLKSLQEQSKYSAAARPRETSLPRESGRRGEQHGFS